MSTTTHHIRAAYASTLQGASLQLSHARDRTVDLWKAYKPQTLIGWTAFTGIALLTASAVCTALGILCGFLLSLAWVGVVMYTLLVAVSTAGAFVLGTGTLLFSGTCAVMGTCILSSACAAHVCLAVFKRVRVVAQTYLDGMQQKPAPMTALYPSSSATTAASVAAAPSSKHIVLQAPSHSSTSYAAGDTVQSMPPQSPPQMAESGPKAVLPSAAPSDLASPTAGGLEALGTNMSTSGGKAVTPATATVSCSTNSSASANGFATLSSLAESQLS